MNDIAIQNPIPKYVDKRNFTYMTFDHGANPDMETLVFALRYQVYCLERGFLPPEDYPDGIEQDEYDPFSTHIAAINKDGLVVGSLRIVSPPDNIPFPFQKHCTRLFTGRAYPPNHECVEISRLVISKVYRRRADDTPLGFSSKFIETGCQQLPPPIPMLPTAGAVDEALEEKRRKNHPEILMGVIRQMYRHCKKTGVGYWYVAMESSLARLLQRIHFAFEPIGEQEDYYGPVTPYLLAISQFEDDLRDNCPAMYDWFQAALRDEQRGQRP